MPLLIGGVVLAVALTLLNLVLTIGVIRRLREHTGLLSARGGATDVMLDVGETPGRFHHRRDRWRARVAGNPDR